jgi:arsenite methyltransferase
VGAYLQLSYAASLMSLVVTSSALRRYQLSQGVYVPESVWQGEDASRKKLWDGIGQTYYGSNAVDGLTPAQLATRDHKTVTGNVGGLWDRFPMGQTYGTILEVGCGYGRASINLSLDKGLNCDHYIGLDLSEPLLRRLQHLKAAYNFYPKADFTLICDSAENLPLADNSVDLILSNAVLMHIEKAKVQQALAEMARVLKPGGAFVLNNSFHNAYCPAHLLRNILRLFLPAHKRSIYTKQYSRREIVQGLQRSGLAAKAGRAHIETNAPYLLLPQALGSKALPWADAINKRLKPRGWGKEILADAFNAYGGNIFD